MTAADAAERFQQLLVAGLAAGPRDNHTFEQIGTYLRTITRLDYATACLTRYLAVYGKYENDVNRSRGDMAFHLVLQRVLQLSSPAQLDNWYNRLTSGQRPRSPLGQRFDELKPSARNELLQLAKAPRQARKEVAGVLTELRDAFQSVNKRPPVNDDELLPFNPVGWNGPLRREYDIRLDLLRKAYNAAAGGPVVAPGLDLGAQCASFWRFVQEQRSDGLRLFQLLAFWRHDQFDARGLEVKSSDLDVIAYLQIAAGLMSYALHTKAYPADVGLQGLTPSEWEFILGPLRKSMPSLRLPHEDSYEGMLRAYPAHADTFPKQCELFLRLLAFAEQKSMSLATNKELAEVAAARAAMFNALIAKIQAGSIASYRPFGFEVTPKESGLLVGAGKYLVGTDIAETFRIVHFVGTPMHHVYVEFLDIPGVVFNMERTVFVHFAKDAVFELVRKYTAPLLALIPLLFQVMLAVPGIASGGFIGLVEAMLNPVEAEIVSSVLKDFGLDGDQAGWWLLAAGLLTHRVRGRLAKELDTRGLNNPAIEDSGVGSNSRMVANDNAPHAGQIDPVIPTPRFPASEQAMIRGGAAVANENVPLSPGQIDPIIPTPRFPASERAVIGGTAMTANENRLTGPSSEELQTLAQDAEVAESSAQEMYDFEWQPEQVANDQFAVEDSREFRMRATASGGGKRGRSDTISHSTPMPNKATGMANRSISGRATGANQRIRLPDFEEVNAVVERLRNQKSVPAATLGGIGSVQSTSRFRTLAERIIRADSNHPLRRLLVNGRFPQSTATGIGEREWLENPGLLEGGHGISGHALRSGIVLGSPGLRLQSAYINRLQSAVIESSTGVVIDNLALDIGGIPVDIGTAGDLAASGLMTMDALRSARMIHF